MTRRLQPHDHVRFVNEDFQNEGVGIVHAVAGAGDEWNVWVEFECNIYRGYSSTLFVLTDEPLPESLS